MNRILFVCFSIIVELLGASQVAYGQHTGLHQIVQRHDYEYLLDTLRKKPLSVVDTFFKSIYSQNLTECELTSLTRTHGILLLESKSIMHALEKANKAVKLNIMCKSDLEEIKINLLLANIYKAQAKRELAFQHFLIAIRLSERHEPSFTTFEIFNGAALTQYQAKNYKECIQMIIKAQKVNLLHPEEFNTDLKRFELMGSYNTLALCYRNIGDFKSSIAKFKISRNLAIAYKNEFWVGLTNGNIGSVYYRMGRYDSAKYYLLIDTRLSRKYEEWESLINGYYLLGALSQREKQAGRAKLYYDSIGAILKSYTFLSFPPYYEEMSNIYYQSKNYRLSADFFRIYHNQIDSLSKLEASKNLSLIQKGYEIEKELHEKELLKKETLLKDIRLERSNYIVLSASLGLTLLCVVTLILYWKNKNRKKLNNSLLFENENLKVENLLAQLNQLKDQVNPHFLFNSLTTLQAMILENDKRANLFVESLSEVYHYVLQINIANLVFVKQELAFAEAYLFMLKNRFEDSIHTTIIVSKESLDKKIPPFSLQLLIENAVKHNIVSATHPLHIDLVIEDQFLSIRNNFQPKQSVVDSTKIGLVNLQKRFDLLGGKIISIEKDEEYFTVKLPIWA